MQEFFAMGGYAFYVWGSFGLAAVLMIAEPLLLRHRYRKWLRGLSRSRERARMRSQRRQSVKMTGKEKMNSNAVRDEHET